jgi:hypothetical protein
MTAKDRKQRPVLVNKIWIRKVVLIDENNSEAGA